MEMEKVCVVNRYVLQIGMYCQYACIANRYALPIGMGCKQVCVDNNQVLPIGANKYVLPVANLLPICMCCQQLVCCQQVCVASMYCVGNRLNKHQQLKPREFRSLLIFIPQVLSMIKHMVSVITIILYLNVLARKILKNIK